MSPVIDFQRPAKPRPDPSSALYLIAVLITAALMLTSGLLVWLGRSIARQFRHHDRDLRAEVEKVNRNFARLIILTEGKEHPHA